MGTCEWCRAAPATRDALIAPEKLRRDKTVKEPELRVRVCASCGAIADRAHERAAAERERKLAERRARRAARGSGR